MQSEGLRGKQAHSIKIQAAAGGADILTLDGVEREREREREKQLKVGVLSVIESQAAYTGDTH